MQTVKVHFAGLLLSNQGPQGQNITVYDDDFHFPRHTHFL